MPARLERDWNDKLAAVAALEQEYAAVPELSARLVSPEERQRILALAQDMPAVWHAPTTTNAERKQLLRLLVKDVTLTKRATTIYIAIRWQTDACTTLEIPRPQRSWERRRTDPAVVTRVRDLAPHQTDREIAAVLNGEGYTAGLGGAFTAAKVQWLRWKYQLPRSRREATAGRADAPRADGRYSARAAAELLNVDVSTIADWCRTGRLEYRQRAPHCPRWITLTPEIIAALHKPTRQRKPRHSSS